MNIRLLVIFLLAGLLLACSDNSSQRGQQFEQPYSQMLVYPKKNPITNFSLSQHDKTQFGPQNFQGRWNLLFMGYTHCPDVCPITLTEMHHVYAALPTELQKKFQVIFLSVDPKRDTLEHIAQYIDHFHQDFVGVTGEKEEIDKLVRALGGIYALNSEDEQYYTVDHTARIFIISPEGERFGIVNHEAMKSASKDKLVEELSVMAGG